MEYLKDHLLSLMRKSAYRPMTLRELISRFDVPRDKRNEFKTLIKELSESGEVVRVKGKRYGLAKKMNLLTGTVSSHPEGFGFVTPEQPGDRKDGDIFIKARNMGSAMHGDQVLVRLEHSGRGRSPEGSIIRILRRAHTTVIGKLERFPGYGYVLPSDHRITQDIYIPLRSLGDAENNEMVAAEIVVYPSRKRNPEGKIIETLGQSGTRGWPKRSSSTSTSCPTASPGRPGRRWPGFPRRYRPADLKGTLDLREKLTVTIDGENAKDFDDAITIELSPKSTYLLWVHVADVSHYVAPGSSLDGKPSSGARVPTSRKGGAHAPRGALQRDMQPQPRRGPSHDDRLHGVFAAGARSCATTSSRPSSAARPASLTGRWRSPSPMRRSGNCRSCRASPRPSAS